MSLFNEFCAAWVKEFPEQEVPRDSEPSVWEGDISAKLQRHRKNLEYLKGEVLKEEFYCKFLEKVISNSEARGQQASPNTSEASAGDSAISEAGSSSTSSEPAAAKTATADFVTVISVNKLIEAQEEQLKNVSVDRPKAPPKPIKHYSRSVSSDSPTKTRPEDVVAWTKQQIQQLQAKQTLKTGDLPDLPILSKNVSTDVLFEVSDSSSSRKRASYENVSRSRQDYVNVFPSSVRYYRPYSLTFPVHIPN